MSDNNTESKSDWSKRELGALWKNQGRNQTYLTGHMKLPGQDEPVKVVVFSNRNKNKANQPDYRVYKSEPRNLDDQLEKDDSTEELLEA